MNVLLKVMSVIGIGLCLGVTPLAALPFNDDMVDVQKRTGSVMRGKVPGTVAVGSVAGPATKEEAKKLVNPMKGDPLSIKNGKRLFQINCESCHGDIAKVPYAPGAVSINSKGYIPGIPLGDKGYMSGMYAEDGIIYATIQFGGLAIMPPLGWKLSPSEHWDIVNYVRQVQRDLNPTVQNSQ